MILFHHIIYMYVLSLSTCYESTQPSLLWALEKRVLFFVAEVLPRSAGSAGNLKNRAPARARCFTIYGGLRPPMRGRKRNARQWHPEGLSLGNGDNVINHNLKKSLTC